MFLKEIYSEPEGLFDKVLFKKGINIISGKQEKEGNKKASLNSIGKSTLISLIDFCLLSNFDKRHKLYKAKEFMDQYKIVLKITINNEKYIIKRSTANPADIIFTKEGCEEEVKKIDDVKRILYKKIFFDSNYKGISNDKWFRKFIPLLIRNEKNGFDNPIQYITEMKRREATIYLLMLMGINNKLAIDNCDFLAELEKKKKDLDGITEAIKDQYGDIESINNQLDKLSEEIKKAESSKDKFQLKANYEQEELEANELTKKIKKLLLENNSLKNLIEEYKGSYELDIDVDIRKISCIYEELNKELGIVLKKTLEDAKNFKDNLIESRRNFIKNKINETGERIERNKEEIYKLDIERSKIFNFLENKKAIEDLTGLFDIISEKKQIYDDLRGKISLIEDMNKSYLSQQTKYAQLQEDINEFLKGIKIQISEIRLIYNNIYDRLYSSDEKEGFFDIIYDKGKKSKIYIIASSKDADGYGKNKGCILVYDLTLLFNIIKQNLHYPKFWIHDGIFNGIYKNQFVSAMNLLNEKSAELDFQYILTLNEDDEIIADEKFGKLDFKIEDHIIAEYTNKKKIFKRDF